MSDEKALRFNTGKPELSYLDLFAAALAGVARTLMYGTQRERNPYPKWNWRKGDRALSIYDSARRHMVDWLNGQDYDSAALADGWQIHNLDFAIGNLMRLRQQLADGTGEDDRPAKARAVSQVEAFAALDALKTAGVEIPKTVGEAIAAAASLPELEKPHEHEWSETMRQDSARRYVWQCACGAEISLPDETQRYRREDGSTYSTWYEAAHAKP